MTNNPMMQALLNVLRARRVIVALVTLAFSGIVLAIPSLAPIQTELIIVTTTLALALIAGYTMKDAAEVSREHALQLPPVEDLRAILRLVLMEVMEELLNDSQGDGSDV